MMMTEMEMAKMYADKYEFVKRTELALRFDKRSDVAHIDYVGNQYSEIVTITYINGEEAKINVHGNSCGAIFREIAAEVYGDGAFGRI